MDAVKDCSIWGRDMGVGGRIFIKVESGTGPVHAPCPKQRAAKLGGADRTAEMWNQFNVESI